ncbi:hypothetical protein MVEG_01965 [Podila verticillata NRRL 6337]|nr:hypothetical protein MVEG_01965 [Podila verticillata NRRL 6337]
MAQRLDLSIAPGKHLGWFRLGTSLWDIIRLLRDQAALIPVVDLKYSDVNPFAADIVLRLASNGIELRFEPLSQRLKLIKVDDFSRLRLTYQGDEVSSTKALPTFLQAYRLFGPTYPGEFDGTKHLYTLSYPGLALVFPIPEKHMLLYQSSADLPLEFPDGTTPVASHMYIYYGADWTTATPVPISTLVRNIQESNSPSHQGGRFGEGKVELERVVAKINYGVALQFAGTTPQQKCLILLHVTTPQDLLADLGSPASIYYKEEDKMKIHSDIVENVKNQDEDDGILGSMDDVGGYDRANRQAEGSQQPNDYFYNYFHLGIDVLFDGSTHRCKKIIMHSNVPGHFDFQSYKRCPFVLHLPSSSHGVVDSSDAAGLPPIAPPSSFTPSPTRQQYLPPPQQQQQQHEGKVGKKKNRGSPSSAGLDPDASPSLSTSSGSGGAFGVSPDLVGTSPIGGMNYPNSGYDHHHQQSTSGLMSVLPERGITPDMKISMIMTLLEPSHSPHSGASTLVANGASAASGSGTANKPAVVLNRGSSTQNPFGPTTLKGMDGVVFEAMKNGHVVTVILY